MICEKPLTLNAREAAELASHAQERGVPVMEAFMYRFHPQWIRAKDLIQTGEIGEIQSIHTVFSYKNTDPANIRNSMERGGGGLYDIGCYAVSSARFLMGREPERVVSMISRDPVDGTDTLTSGILDFNGARAVFTVGTRMVPRQEVQVFGSKGSLRVVLPFNAYPDVPLELVVDNGIGPRTIECGPADQYRAMFEAFVLALREGGPVPTPLTDAVANMSVIDAMFRSGESGLWEEVGTDRS